MLRLRTRIGAVASLALAAMAIYGCGGIPGDATVSVGGKPITKATFEHWLATSARAGSFNATPAVVPDPPRYTKCVAQLEASQPKPAKGQKPPTAAALRIQCEQKYQQLKQQALHFLITTEWVLGEAEEQGVSVSDEEVIKQFNQVKSQQFHKEADFQKLLAKTGETVSDVLLRVKVEKLSSKLQAKVTKDAGHVSRAEVAKYYDEHTSSYGQPERRNILLILTATAAQAQKAKREISRGKSFANIAKSSSIDPVSKSSGGTLDGVAKGQEERALDEAIFKARPNVLTGPVKTAFGYYLVEVKKILPSSQQTLTQAQAQIRQTLETERSQQALTNFAKEFEKRWRARTDCRAEYVVSDCKQYKLAPNTTPPPEAPSQTVTTPPVKPTHPAPKKKK